MTIAILQKITFRNLGGLSARCRVDAMIASHQYETWSSWPFVELASVKLGHGNSMPFVLTSPTAKVLLISNASQGATLKRP